jgi:hypothetical protein
VGLDPAFDHDDYGAFSDVLDDLGGGYNLNEVTTHLGKGSSTTNNRVLQ